MKHHNVSPIKRVHTNAKGEKVVRWRARYPGPDGRYRYAKPAWNGGSATFVRKKDAQRAINEALGSPMTSDTVDGFLRVWQQPGRSERTAKTNRHRMSRIVDLQIEGKRLGSWKLAELDLGHMEILVDRLFVEQGRSPQGVTNMIRALSVLFEDARKLRLCDHNPTRGVRVSSNDRRATKANRRARVWSVADLHRFTTGGRAEVRVKLDPQPVGAAFDYEAMLRVFTDCGLRLGEVLALKRDHFTGDTLLVRGNAHNGVITEGDTEQKRHVRDVPVPPGLATLLREMMPRIGTDLLFPTPRGKVWRERNFYRDVWEPARRATGLRVNPHDCRHSWVSHLRAAGMDDARLALIAGHRVETMLSRYTHAVVEDDQRIGEVFG